MFHRIISRLGSQRLTAIAAAGFLLLGAALVTVAGFSLRPPRGAEVVVASTNQPGALLPVAIVSPVTVGSVPPKPRLPAGITPPMVDSIRVTPTGETVLSGTAAPGSRVEIMDGPVTVGAAQANAGGGFALGLDKPLAPGVHQLAVRSTSKDGATQLLSDARWSVTVPGPKPAAAAAGTQVPAPGSPSPVAAVPAAAPAEVASLGTTPAPTGPEPKPGAVLTGQNGTRTITVQPGDNLWTIAQAALGDGSAWETIYRANRKVIRNPRQLMPGQVLVVPGTGK